MPFIINRIITSFILLTTINSIVKKTYIQYPIILYLILFSTLSTTTQDFC